MRDDRRSVFLSAPFLSKQYKSIPDEVLEASILFFGAKRSWLFPSNSEEMLEAKKLSEKYLEFDEDYKSFILRKEKQNLVHWLLPSKDYQRASEFFANILDPVSKENYLPLILDKNWWQTEFVSTDGKYTKNAEQIISNFNSGEFDYEAVMELLYQSNPTLIPTLYWAES